MESNIFRVLGLVIGMIMATLPIASVEAQLFGNPDWNKKEMGKEGDLWYKAASCSRELAGHLNKWLPELRDQNHLVSPSLFWPLSLREPLTQTATDIHTLAQDIPVAGERDERIMCYHAFAQSLVVLDHTLYQLSGTIKRKEALFSQPEMNCQAELHSLLYPAGTKKTNLPSLRDLGQHCDAATTDFIVESLLPPWRNEVRLALNACGMILSNMPTLADSMRAALTTGNPCFWEWVDARFPIVFKDKVELPGSVMDAILFQLDSLGKEKPFTLENKHLLEKATLRQQHVSESILRVIHFRLMQVMEEEKQSQCLATYHMWRRELLEAMRALMMAIDQYQTHAFRMATYYAECRTHLCGKGDRPPCPCDGGKMIHFQ